MKNLDVINEENITQDLEIISQDEILRIDNTSVEEEKSIERIRDEKYFISQIDSLKAQIAEKDVEYANLLKSYDSLQIKYTNIKEEISSSNEDLIFHYRMQNESLTKRLEQAQNESDKMREIKNARIDALEDDIYKLSSKIKELNLSLQEKLKTDLENLTKSEQADKLVEQIHKLESQKAELVQQIEKMHLEVMDANTRANDMERVLVGVSNSLNRTNEKIGKCLKIKADLTQEKAPIADTQNQEVENENLENTQLITNNQEDIKVADATIVKEQINNFVNCVPSEDNTQTQNVEPIKEETDEPLSIREKQILERERKLNELRESHEELNAYQKSEKKGFFSWVANRAASFLP